MSLRNRLFLWVSGLFVVVATCTYFLENYLTQRELKKAQVLLRKEILDISEKRRFDLQNYLASSIAEDGVRIDALLSNISSFSPQALRFGPTMINEQKGTWGDASDLLLEYKWIDFIQNTNQGRTTAALLPRQTPMGTVYRVDIDEELSWIYSGDLEQHPEPYLAVHVPYSLVTHAPVGMGDEILEHISGVVPTAYLLFDLKEMREAKLDLPSIDGSSDQRQWPPIPVKWTEGYELELDPFVAAFQRSKELLLANKIQPPQYTLSELKERVNSAVLLQDGRLNAIPVEPLLSSISNEQLMKQRFEAVALRYTQINLIWVLIAMFDSGMFGQDIFAFPSPVAATVFSMGHSIGVGIDTKDVLFSKRIFDDSSYYQANPSKQPHSNLGASLAVIPSPSSTHVFLGNTAKFLVKTLSEERTGYLTVGVGAESILQKLVLAIHQTAVLVHEGKVCSAYGDEGAEIDVVENSGFPIAQMLKETSGLVSWKGKNYFYMHTQPFPEVDLHFFLLNPEAKEFALLHDLESGSQRVVDAIRLNIHIAGFIALLIVILLVHNIARNITKPIVQLAMATKDVAEGRLDKIKLSLPPQKHNDEISVLCHSFEEMVKGLQEREKVKGVLNKVVSREIALEILKGSVHLGGEEKKVSVLFADIRDFTDMTKNMKPQQVIELLNTCMTRISLAIDKNNGVIDKYVGDEAMALFGAPISRSEDACNAIKSALEMIESVKEWNQERAAQGESSIELGIGIHTGWVLAGNMGAENRLNYTVIGSNVNLASRLCGAAKRMEILITKDTLDEPFVKERIVFETVPPVVFRGFDKPVEVFRVLGIKK
jgi:class 3 adenylate cyclase